MIKNKISQAQIDELYGWIKKVISSCEAPCHIEPCSELIDIFERRNPPEYLVKSLRELLKIHEQSVNASKNKLDKSHLEERINELFNTGNSPKEIADILDQKYHVVLDVINRKRKSSKKKV